MTIEKIKRMLDACYQAKRIRDMLPPLPEGVTPSYLHYLDVMENRERQGLPVKVSDISDTLHLPRPGVTRTVKEMEAKGYLQKQASAEDGRVTYLTITGLFPPGTTPNISGPWSPIWTPFPTRTRTP